LRLPCQRGERTEREKDEEGKARKASRRLFAIVVCYRFSPLHFSHFCLPHQVAFLSRASVLVCVCVCACAYVFVCGGITRALLHAKLKLKGKLQLVITQAVERDKQLHALAAQFSSNFVLE